MTGSDGLKHGLVPRQLNRRLQLTCLTGWVQTGLETRMIDGKRAVLVDFGCITQFNDVVCLHGDGGLWLEL